MRLIIFTITIFFMAMMSSLAQIKITGKVLDVNGESLRSVNVSLNGNDKNEGTTTDANGNFTLSLDDTGNYDLEIRFVGFQPNQQKLLEHLEMHY